MNGRLHGLYAALQGGTRRKPAYLNSGALVSWVYAIKTLDKVGFGSNLLNTTLLDTTFESAPTDGVLVSVALSAVALQDPLINCLNEDSVMFAGTASNLVLTDVVKTYTHSDSVSLTANIVSGSIFMTDNVKTNTSADTVVFNASISNIAFGAP